jgi:hypothetical protein
MACRSKERGEKALETVRRVVGSKARVELMELDTVTAYPMPCDTKA